MHARDGLRPQVMPVAGYDMMKRFAIVAVPVLLVGWIIAGVAWLFWPSITGHLVWCKALRHIEDHPVARFQSPDQVSFVCYEVNTFTHELNSSTIAEFYEEACAHMARRYGSASLRTYSWNDGKEGWGRVSTVHQGDAGYIAVTASCNNDNDSASVLVRMGTFQRAGQKLLPSAVLPRGLLRCTWDNTKGQPSDARDQ